MWRPAFRTGIVWTCNQHMNVCVHCMSSRPSPLEADGIEGRPKLNQETVERYSFIKDLFLGKFDTGILSYPITRESASLERLLFPIEEYFHTKVNSDVIDREAVIPRNIIDDLKQFGLFGQRVPSEYGGLGLSALEYTRLRETTSKDSSICDMLYGHEALGLKGILLYGNEEQKRKYLPKLSKGEWIATLCLSENDFGPDIKTISTRARLSDDGLTWKLSGRKKWVINAPVADVFTVLAAVQVQDRVGKKHDTLGVFIVEKNFGGITVGNPGEKLGRRASTLCEVTFEDTAVPVENVLGEIGLGYQIAVDILIADQFSAGSATAGLLKNLIKSAVEFSENRDRLGKSAVEYLMTRIRLAEVSNSVYAMESMSYITAGILDHHHNADCSVESAMIKVFSSENLWRNVNEFQDVFGNNSFVEGFEYGRIFRDSRTTIFPMEENDMSRLFIALAGLQHAGISLHEAVKKLRNPFFYPGFLIKKIFQSSNQEKDKPKLHTGIENFVHPNLQAEGEHLEYAVQRLKYVTEVLLTRYGQEVTDSEMELCRLADIAINIFAMAAVIARASHSSFVGLQNSEVEMLMAKMFCSSALQEVKSKVQDIVDGPLVMSVFNYRRIAKKVFKSKGYFPQHPLTRNF